ncbi:uncharacterized protein LOC132302751 [Cornus florida]|uniref:uncharacterized protein LOC132302751 n=1 Tax=Cornus florida TaxID=4283 RepID=UPI00289937EF|nr:uncharacterized protein LOC132302751 [Cornus florida]
MTTPLRPLLPLLSAFCPSDFSSSSMLLHTTNPSRFHIYALSTSPSSASSSFDSFRRCFGRNKSHHNLSYPSKTHAWLCGYAKRDQNDDSLSIEDQNHLQMFGSDEEVTTQIPTQAQSVVEGSGAGAVLISEYKPAPDVDYLQELLAIQQQGPRVIGFFGTRNMGFMHQELIEILSYAMVITKNHIFTSGASGTNAAVIRGALRAEKPELLTVILPQSLKKQPPESQELLSKVKNVIEKPHNDHLPLIEASRLCNMDIISQVQQVICFAFHDSRLLMETCQEAKNMRKIVTLFYLD